MASPFTKFDHLRIPLEDVKTATNNFNDDNIITEGDCEPTYKGQLLHSGRMIKITARRLDRKYGIRDVEFWSEISVLSDLKHTNIVSFIGFCDEEDVKIIITTYHPKGSLNEYLNSSKLTCTQRLRISVGVAHALSYLHHEEGRGYGVIHRNINSYTILLDENWEAKLHDFEICIKQPNSRMDHPVLCEPIGIHGYTDPTIENTGGVSHKSDIYSFGVVLFEILCGRAAYIENATDELLAPMAKYQYENNSVKDIIHPGLWNEMSPQALVKYSNIAYSCLEEEPSHRPDINDIAKQLEVAVELQLRRENVVNP